MCGPNTPTGTRRSSSTSAPTTHKRQALHRTFGGQAGGRVKASAEALTGPTTPEGAQVQSTDLPGCETGPGQVAARGRSTADRANAFGFQWKERPGRQAHHLRLDGPPLTRRTSL
ncbi:DUF1326 domain-containing protein [Streptomyces sp. NPDC048340]|uniref:DUF1326 domain-containing protein n=1 Tax=Streptomyces sp. NPDC048340 TaxID=3365537 RepID=UPI003721F865